MSDNVIDAAHLAHQREWSARTFGPGARTAGVLDHITKEIEEVRAAPEDVTEWADLLILAFDGAWRAGHEPQTVIDAIKAKQERNESREWPDWRNADPNKAIEHVRDEEPFVEVRIAPFFEVFEGSGRLELDDSAMRTAAAPAIDWGEPADPLARARGGAA